MRAMVIRGMLAAVLLLGTPGLLRAEDHQPLAIDARQRRVEIRQLLLQKTPLGCDVATVQKFLSTRVLKPGDPKPILRDHGAKGPSAKQSKNRGTQSIQADLGDYLASPAALTLPTPVVLEGSLIAQWAFDSNGKLIEIFLDRKMRK